MISTDGLFDNLYEDEIALAIDTHLNSLASASVTAGQQTKHISVIDSCQLDSTCAHLIEMARRAGIKKDDMLIMLVYIE